MKKYEGYDIEGLLSVIKELEAVNDILWEYIWEKDMEEIRDRMEKLDV
jgi:ubiquinone biosynthesis protein Coq4